MLSLNKKKIRLYKYIKIELCYVIDITRLILMNTRNEKKDPANEEIILLKCVQ